MDASLPLVALILGGVLAFVAIQLGQRSVARERLGLDAPADRILPRIRTRAYVANLRKAGARGDDAPVTEPLLDELVVAYGFDLPDRFRMVTPRDLTRLQLTASSLRKLAVRNLAEKVRDRVEVRSLGPIFQIVAGENVEASLLLLERVWRAQAASAEGDIVVSVPTRDVLLYADSSDPLALELIVGVTDDAWRAAGDDAISRTLLVWRDPSWAPYDGDADERGDGSEDE